MACPKKEEASQSDHFGLPVLVGCTDQEPLRHSCSFHCLLRDWILRSDHEFSEIDYESTGISVWRCWLRICFLDVSTAGNILCPEFLFETGDDCRLASSHSIHS